jgi:hypothetical protein
MSGDFSEPDRSGLAEWLDAWGVPGDVPAQDEGPGQGDGPCRHGGPAYVVSFGWFPSRLSPTLSIPAPRRAGDDVLRDDPR